ncbi:uncharacterized protein PGTG_21302 [Puccinia graminis f. sp. tritici CRL 75-36-700-3]|uniref:Uncharacterized protein n=1 Tax=Puccinia graminis f. sp. tritici (strain CRL 75-36-700-3 / race SCCL) TaxID=418459 RepID=H6QR35_PUCGT|nr:uncharacterized protein PGTG_21302 [Puccinia graminis f. sp. tritici CRL 75-36-700-3]EHS63010.1 hypothetical protein PGTG_21302 [Puccinia graminis f. sp. tritici CRL 75-36-700-3]
MDKTLKDEYNTDVENEMKQLQTSPSTPDKSLAAVVKKVSKTLEFNEDGGLRVLPAIDKASNLINPGVFGIFNDTISRVTNFNPSLSQDCSSRHHGFGSKLFAPIFKISSLDVFVPEAPPSSWDELLSPERLFTYGCPFYGLYFKGIMILLNSRLASSELSEPQCFAILGSLIQTRLTLHSPISSELVASHAAHCMFIDST